MAPTLCGGWVFHPKAMLDEEIEVRVQVAVNDAVWVGDIYRLPGDVLRVRRCVGNGLVVRGRTPPRIHYRRFGLLVRKLLKKGVDAR